ncbi:MAG: hypothetical protein OXU85_00220 [Thaumarchaeota archaeon]|nr:hypothetical protein [Nitrososphaerota archaeon]MDD9842314.1 hypothetical protein [Nitrososphaerota archaeon]
MVLSRDTMDAETRERLYGVIITMIFAAVLVTLGPGLITFLAGTDSEATVYSGLRDIFKRFNDNLRAIVVAILVLSMLAAIAKLRLGATRSRTAGEPADGEGVDEDGARRGRRCGSG